MIVNNVTTDPQQQGRLTNTSTIFTKELGMNKIYCDGNEEGNFIHFLHSHPSRDPTEMGMKKAI